MILTTTFLTLTRFFDLSGRFNQPDQMKNRLTRYMQKKYFLIVYYRVNMMLIIINQSSE